MLVSFPFTIRRDILTTRTYERGTIEAVGSELLLLVTTEEGELVHIPTYGVQKRDLLFSGDVVDAKLGVLMTRIQDKIRLWMDTKVDIIDIRVSDQSRNRVSLIVSFRYNAQNSDVQLEVSQ